MAEQKCGIAATEARVRRRSVEGRPEELVGVRRRGNRFGVLNMAVGAYRNGSQCELMTCGAATMADLPVIHYFIIPLQVDYAWTRSARV